MDKDVVAEKRDIYYDPRVGLQSAERLCQKANEEGAYFTKKRVKEWV